MSNKNFRYRNLYLRIFGLIWLVIVITRGLGTYADTPSGAFDSPISPISPVSPIIISPPEDNYESENQTPTGFLGWGLLIPSGIAVSLSGGVLAFHIAQTRRRMSNDPDYFYRLLYYKINSVGKNWQFLLLNTLYSRSSNPIDKSTIKLLQVHAEARRPDAKVDFLLTEWIQAIENRETLFSSRLGYCLLQLSLILQQATTQRTLMQIYDFNLKVISQEKDNISVTTKHNQVMFEGQRIWEIQSPLLMLGKVSQIICKYVDQIVDNTVSETLEQTLDAIPLTGEPNKGSYLLETRVAQQIIEKWRNIGRSETTRNPYIAGRPITKDKPFFGRDRELLEIMRLLTSTHIAIWGKRRIGKTSVLHHLADRLLLQLEEKHRFLPIFLNVDPLSGKDQDRLFYLMVETTAHSIEQQFSIQTLPLIYERKSSHDYNFSDSEQDLEQILKQLHQEIPGFEVRLVWLIDEIDKVLQSNPEIQQHLQTIANSPMLKPNVVFVFAGLNHPSNFVKQDQDNFYSSFHSINLGPFSPENARRLVIEPVKPFHYFYQNDAVEIIIQKCKYEPYWIQFLCREALTIALGQGRHQITVSDVQEAMKHLPKHAPVFEEKE